MTWREPCNGEEEMVHADRGVAQCLLALVALLLWLPPAAEACQWDKLTFDPGMVDDAGLIGPPGGQRHLDFEFCAPADPDTLRYLESLSPTLRCHPPSPGRLACPPEQTLCIDSTGSPDWSWTLCGYTLQIRPTWWE
jgi:hypothetical protein